MIFRIVEGSCNWRRREVSVVCEAFPRKICPPVLSGSSPLHLQPQAEDDDKHL